MENTEKGIYEMKVHCYGSAMTSALCPLEHACVWVDIHGKRYQWFNAKAEAERTLKCGASYTVRCTIDDTLMRIRRVKVL
jgi:hypothetical protein